MSSLSLLDESRCFFHLGYGNGSGIPAGDVAQLTEAARKVRNDYQLRRLKEILARCDSAWEQTELGQGVSATELYAGDINRSVQRTFTAEAQQIWHENYLRETDYLAQELNVPNYRHADTRAYAFSRWGGEYVNAIPGPADTSVGTRIYLFRRFG
jgi:hypothetical protein